MERKNASVDRGPDDRYLVVAVAAAVVAFCAIVGFALLVTSVAIVFETPGELQIALGIALPVAGVALAWLIFVALTRSADKAGRR
jgi:hypothetical protein